MKPSSEDEAAPAGGPWEECFEAAVQLALRAGQIIKKALSEEKRVSTKTSAADLVTETDHLVEDLIISELQKKFPSHRFIAEESAAAGAKCVLTPSPTWIVDPIDGTCNFVHRFPTVAVSIGFAVDQELEFGVIYHCTEERLYTGQRGRGAFCNGQRLQVSGETDGLRGSERRKVCPCPPAAPQRARTRSSPPVVCGRTERVGRGEGRGKERISKAGSTPSTEPSAGPPPMTR
ncbi:inositol monophosphatase 2 isoform X3 [Mustela nigripes]|uniref:inositol monophosphatase 2 isoform X3 n=1 Tax=Mustela lutreola TaxID=9666 RepID=UPI002797BD50|nr:inositol monophosphatase 2 isoform X3 [Mustela lutreola]XP_059265147.1 inositol monophosphatase 2 isoform X3 [Mustela nigripes]